MNWLVPLALDEEYIIIFRGGSGGHFVRHIFSNFVLQEIPEDWKVSLQNEYVSRDIQSKIDQRHLDDLFKCEAQFIYTIHRYKELLNYYKHNNIKIVVILCDQRTQLYTEILELIKHYHSHNRSDTNSWYNSKGSLNDIIFGYNKLIANSPSSCAYKHYKFFSHMLKIYNVPHLNLNYQDFIMKQDKKLIEQLFHFCEQPVSDEKINNVVDEVKEYHKANIELVNEYEYDESYEDLIKLVKSQ